MKQLMMFSLLFAFLSQLALANERCASPKTAKLNFVSSCIEQMRIGAQNLRKKAADEPIAVFCRCVATNTAVERSANEACNFPYRSLLVHELTMSKDAEKLCWKLSPLDMKALDQIVEMGM